MLDLDLDLDLEIDFDLDLEIDFDLDFDLGFEAVREPRVCSADRTTDFDSPSGTPRSPPCRRP